MLLVRRNPSDIKRFDFAYEYVLLRSFSSTTARIQMVSVEFIFIVLKFSSIDKTKSATPCQSQVDKILPILALISTKKVDA